jgi:hypothetical protein
MDTKFQLVNLKQSVMSFVLFFLMLHVENMIPLNHVNKMFQSLLSICDSQNAKILSFVMQLPVALKCMNAWVNFHRLTSNMLFQYTCLALPFQFRKIAISMGRIWVQYIN